MGYLFLYILFEGVELGLSLMLSFYYTFAVKHRTRFHVWFAIFLSLISVQIFYDFILYPLGVRFDKAYCEFQALFNLYIVPVGITLVLSVLRPLISSATLLRYTGYMLLFPFICTVVYLITFNSICCHLSTGYSVLLLLGFATRLPKRLKEYNAGLINVYSEIGNRSLAWLKVFIGVLALWITSYLMIVILPMGLGALIYIGMSVIFLFITNHFIFHQEAVNVESMKAVNVEESEVAGEAEDAFNSLMRDNSKIESALIENVERTYLYLKPDLNVETVARAIYSNIRYLSFHLNTVKHTNFNAYINGLRVRYACNMIESDPQISLDEVVSASGFNTASTFNRVFRQQYGVSPHEYATRYMDRLSKIQQDSPVAQSRSERWNELVLMDDGAEAFTKEFIERHPLFVQGLIATNAKISAKEQLVCMLFYLDIDNAIIANKVGISRESLRVIKTRLNHKLNPNNEFASLNSFLKSLDKSNRGN